LVAAGFEPERFLETAAMPFFLVTLIGVLMLYVPGAFLGAVGRRGGRALARAIRRRKGDAVL
jgi:hypothetical protein